MQERVTSKTKVTVELDAAMVAAARVKGIDLALLFEQALAARIDAGRSGALSDEDRASMEAYNTFIEEHGTLADAFRNL